MDFGTNGLFRKKSEQTFCSEFFSKTICLSELCVAKFSQTKRCSGLLLGGFSPNQNFLWNFSQIKCLFGSSVWEVPRMNVARPLLLKSAWVGSWVWVRIVGGESAGEIRGGERDGEAG